MTVPWRRSLAARLLATLGAATLLPLVLLMTAVLLQAYQATSGQTFETVQQTSRRYASDFEARLEEKLGLMKAIASIVRPGDEGQIQRLLAMDPDLKRVWVHREGQPGAGDAFQHDLYAQVKARGTEVLSAPDFDRDQASLGFPLLEQGRFVGMVAITFSLGYFQQVIEGVRVYQTGYALLVSHEGYRIAHPDKTLIGVRVGNDVDPEQAATMLSKISQGQEFSIDKRALLTGKWSRQYYTPILVGRAWNPWFLVVVVPTEEATSRLNNLFLLMVLGTAATLFLVFGATWWSTRSVILPLRRLARGAEDIANGDYDTRVEWSSKDEVGVLAVSFNRMTDRLVGTLRHQQEMVKRRTAKLVDTEKMAVLGQLTASIAHEVNTPLGAIRSSATFLSQGILARLEDLPDYFRTMTEEQLSIYRSLVVRSRDTLGPPVDDRKRRRRLGRLLEEAGLEPDLADDMVSIAPEDDDERLLALASAGHGHLIRLAGRALAMIRASSIILEAADRAASTVTALVDYARIEDLGAEQTIDPAKELDTLMTLYYGVAKTSVEVVRNYEPGVTVQGDRGRLNQVWANLISNALQAMDYRGKLVLSVAQGPEGPVVSVANDGPTIPPDLRERIFEPFFTTKKSGLGTGLGLDICRRIVEAHGAHLELSEEDGLTRFSVSFSGPVDPHKPVH